MDDDSNSVEMVDSSHNTEVNTVETKIKNGKRKASSESKPKGKTTLVFYEPISKIRIFCSVITWALLIEYEFNGLIFLMS